MQPISLLSSAADDPLPGQIVPPPPPIAVEGEEPKIRIEAVEDARKVRGTLKYRIRWVGYPSLIWEPWYFVNATEAVAPFHKRHPGKPGPMPEGSEVAEVQCCGLSTSGFAGAQSLGGGYCYGSSLGDDKPSSTTPAATMHATLSGPASGDGASAGVVNDGRFA